MNFEKVFMRIGGAMRPIDDLPELELSAVRTEPSNGTGELYDLRLINQGAESIEVDSVEIRFDDASFFRDAVEAYRFYKEGLTVVGVSGVRGAGDCDFELDSGFMRFMASDPENYSWEREGVFTAEQLGVVSNEKRDESILFGFVTADSFFCRVVMNLEVESDIHITAIVDTDGMVLEAKSEIRLEKLMVASGTDVENLLEDCAAETAVQMKAIPGAASLTGWCSYYYYYGQETEDDIIENALFISQNRDTLPIDYIQIDDGWQKARGNWMETNPEKFPHGMEWLADEIKRLGLKPGIWVAPYLVSEDTEVYRKHDDWLLRDSNGELLLMGDNYFLDATHPKALEWLTDCFKTMRGWGYSYFKLDFMMVETCVDAQYHDKNATRVRAYRKGLAAIREAIGDDAYILAGTALMAPDVGLINGSRITTDVTPFWSLPGNTPESPTIFNVCRNMINRSYTHQRLWTNDPDCLIVRENHNRAKYAHIPSLTWDETRMLASAMIFSGGSLFLGDRLAVLPEERLDILRKTFKLAGGAAGYPVDRMVNIVPRVWLCDGGEGNGIFLLGVFNWSEEPQDLSAELAHLGESPDGLLVDIWTERSFASFAELAEYALPSHRCLLLKLERK